MAELTESQFLGLFDAILNKNGWASIVPYKFEYGSEPITSPVFNKISLCTTVMNRTDDLIETLPKNIQDNSDYPDIEFVILDYNSSGKNFSDLYRFLKQPEYLLMMDNGYLSYYRTNEPTHYSMAKSRNLAFRHANGRIIINVDADNFTNVGFASKINQLANEKPEKAVFAKGSRMLRGRLGFYKDEFINLLGGYNEDLIGYGADDRDILNRAFGLGFTAMCFGGKYIGALKDKPSKTENMANKNWRYTEKLNKVISFFNLLYKIYKANESREWGHAELMTFKDLSE